MPLTLEMKSNGEFVPEHQEEYAMFLVDDMYGSLEFKYMTCEFHYAMVDAYHGYQLPCSVIYTGDDLPFNTPLLFKGESPYLLTEEEKHSRIYQDDPEQCFWWIKTWFLSDRRNCQINPEELDEYSLGIMKVSDMKVAVKQANIFRNEVKLKNRGV